MKTLNFFVVLFILIFLKLDLLYSQLNRPLKYNAPIENMDLSKNHDVGVTWVVFSDRANNKTYTEPGGTTERKTLGFLDKFFIAEETKEWVKLIKDDSFDIFSLKFSNNAENYGWIKKENLLLWNYCLVTDVRTKINRKAILLNTINVLKNSKHAGTYCRVPIYLDPELRINSNLRLNEILFIYKITENAILLGKTTECAMDETIKNTIIGWVPKNMCIFWDYRIAVEPNPDRNAVAERRENNIKAHVFKSKASAIKYRNGDSIYLKDVIWNADHYNERPSGSWMRFPLLENDVESGIIKVIIISEIEGIKNILEGYTTFNINGLKYPLFKNVLFMTKNELSDMLKIFQDLSIAVGKGEQRIAMQNTWKEILKRYLGEDTNFEDMTMEEINRKVFGLLGSSTLLINVRLKDITNPAIVPDAVFRQYVERIRRSSITLKRIFNEGKYYRFAFTSNDETYFWILEDFIP